MELLNALCDHDKQSSLLQEAGKMPLFRDDWKRRIDRAEKQLQKRLREEQEKASTLSSLFL